MEPQIQIAGQPPIQIPVEPHPTAPVVVPEVVVEPVVAPKKAAKKK